MVGALIKCFIKPIEIWFDWVMKLFEDYDIEVRILGNLATSLIYISATIFTILYTLNKGVVTFAAIYFFILIASFYVILYGLIVILMKAIRSGGKNKEVKMENVQGMAIGLIGMLLIYIFLIVLYCVGTENFETLFYGATKLLYSVGLFMALLFSSVFPILTAMAELNQEFKKKIDLF